MHYLYILYSLKDHKLYKGTTADVIKRFIRHNTGGNKSTAHRKPFVLIHVETFESKREALKKELYYKSLLGAVELREHLVKNGTLTADGYLRN